MFKYYNNIRGFNLLIQQIAKLKNLIDNKIFKQRDEYFYDK